MFKIESFEEVLKALKEGFLITNKKNAYFILKNNKIYAYHNSNRLILKIDDFIALYQKELFYFYEDDDIFIDNIKDLEYYNFKHK